MSVNLTVTEKIEITSGETLVESPVVTTDEYIVISVSVPKATVKKEVDLGGVNANLKLFAIMATEYPSTVDVPDLSFYLHLDSETPNKLDSMLMLVGSAIATLLPAETDKIFISNASATTDVVVKILIAQDVTP